jgi:hypothetical protein
MSHVTTHPPQHSPFIPQILLKAGKNTSTLFHSLALSLVSKQTSRNCCMLRCFKPVFPDSEAFGTLSHNIQFVANR